MLGKRSLKGKNPVPHKLFAPFRHQNRDLFRINTHHRRPEILGKLSKHPRIIEVRNRLHHRSRTLRGIAGLENS